MSDDCLRPGKMIRGRFNPGGCLGPRISSLSLLEVVLSLVLNFQ